MGITSMFSSNANLAGLFVSSVPQKISEVKHKAFLDVNEAGSEAAAATCKCFRFPFFFANDFINILINFRFENCTNESEFKSEGIQS